jgi:hypothetical protein
MIALEIKQDPSKSGGFTWTFVRMSHPTDLLADILSDFLQGYCCALQRNKKNKAELDDIREIHFCIWVERWTISSFQVPFLPTVADNNTRHNKHKTVLLDFLSESEQKIISSNSAATLIVVSQIKTCWKRKVLLVQNSDYDDTSPENISLNPAFSHFLTLLDNNNTFRKKKLILWKFYLESPLLEKKLCTSAADTAGEKKIVAVAQKNKQRQEEQRHDTFENLKKELQEKSEQLQIIKQGLELYFANSAEAAAHNNHHHQPDNTTMDDQTALIISQLKQISEQEVQIKTRPNQAVKKKKAKALQNNENLLEQNLTLSTQKKKMNSHQKDSTTNVNKSGKENRQQQPRYNSLVAKNSYSSTKNKKNTSETQNDISESQNIFFDETTTTPTAAAATITTGDKISPYQHHISKKVCKT